MLFSIFFASITFSIVCLKYVEKNLSDSYLYGIPQNLNINLLTFNHIQIHCIHMF